MAVRIVVEKVSDREPADDQGNAIDVAFAFQLIGAVGDIFLFAAETEGLFDVIALRTDFRERGAGLLRLAVRKAGDAERAVEPEALREFRVEIELGPLPEPDTEKGRRRPGFLELSAAGKTVGAGIRRANGGIALRQECGLPMDIPIRRLRKRGLRADHRL